jgi:HD-like signal output (HDOD) protein
MSLGHDTIITLGGKLPPALGVLGRLREVLDDPDCDLDELVELLQVDAALTFQIIRLSNSALYGLGARCQSLDEAVARVGFGEIHQLVTLIVARQAMQNDLALYGIPAGRLWENSVAVGSLAGALAARADLHAGGAYSAGLLRNLGRIIFNNHIGAAAYPGEEAEPDVFAWEKRAHGMTAPEATAVLLDHWRFPPEICGAVCAHAVPEQAAAGSVRGAAVLHLACARAVGWGCTLPGERTVWRRDEALLALAGIEADHVEGAIADAKRQFSRFATIEWARAA